jgi:colanic acid/amylovoran biosynthesis glycosyltransferase
MAQRPAVYVVAVNPRDLELSFIRPHLERLPADTIGVYGYVPTIDGRPVLSDRALPRLARKAARLLQRRGWDEEITRGYAVAFDRRPAAVLAEFGPTAVRLVEPCRRTGLPLIAHFHGYDTSVRSVLDEHREGYQSVFRNAAAIIAVSRSMWTTLMEMGAPEERLHYCPYGVDCTVFHPGNPAAAPPTVLAVGRLVDKKGPHLTILAFAEVLKLNPRARLRMIGDGPLLGSCADLVSALRIEHAVTLLGHQPHHVIANEMRQARCFAQHSVQAWNGDSEGTPNTVLEAGASGLAVVSTRHAGIPDVVIEGETGYLVDERDLGGMARAMVRLLDDAHLAHRLGQAARHHIANAFAIERRVGQLWEIIDAAIAGTPRPGATMPSPAPRRAAGLIRR